MKKRLFVKGIMLAVILFGLFLYATYLRTGQMPVPNVNPGEWFAQVSQKVTDTIQSLKAQASQLAEDATESVQQSAADLQTVAQEVEVFEQPGNPVYRWRDAEGNLYFGDHPPEDALELTPMTENALTY
ncbi:hypothetical protein QSV34_02640 [Porticoccus sp. W117]|uniref:hypothetical protein n=1 Tax=Porticoccus sp. W117 TaxID=3054777 RepID=UPI0025977A5D|nr:hypothetical protein [Porticoccus sp. W117]MDM3870248.1 hypothetical protein [Porticoccus sp. W117]